MRNRSLVVLVSCASFATFFFLGGCYSLGPCGGITCNGANRVCDENLGMCVYIDGGSPSDASVDAGRLDAGAPDAGVDAGSSGDHDAGPADAGELDAGASDAGDVDAGGEVGGEDGGEDGGSHGQDDAGEDAG